MKVSLHWVFFLNTKLNKRISRIWFWLVFQSISTLSSLSWDIMLSENWASSTSDSDISNGLWVFSCALKIISCSLRTLYPSAQGLHGLKQLISSSSSPLPPIVKAYILIEETSYGRHFHKVHIQSRTNLRGTGFMLPLSVNSWALLLNHSS